MEIDYGDEQLLEGLVQRLLVVHVDAVRAEHVEDGQEREHLVVWQSGDPILQRHPDAFDMKDPEVRVLLLLLEMVFGQAEPRRPQAKDDLPAHRRHSAHNVKL